MKAKRICQQAFLWLLTALSAAALVWTTAALRRARAAVSGIDFLDAAVRSMDEAAALMARVDTWQTYRRAALIALVTSAALTASYYIWLGISRRHASRPAKPKKQKKSEAPAPEPRSAPHFCPHCGTPLGQSAAFCPGCGKRVG